VRTVRLIKRMQEVGFTLRELSHFLRLLEIQPHNPAERRAYAEAKLGAIDAQIERLRAMRDELSKRLLTCECCNAPPANADDELGMLSAFRPSKPLFCWFRSSLRGSVSAVPSSDLNWSRSKRTARSGCDYADVKG